MLDRNYLRKHADRARERLRARGADLALDEMIALDTEWKQNLTRSENLRRHRKMESEKIGQLRKQGLDTSDQQAQVKAISSEIKAMETEVEELKLRLDRLLHGLPNLPHESVPIGGDEEANLEVRRSGSPPHFDFEPRDHVDIGQELGILDVDRGIKMAGARFSLLSGLGARLERALINFMLDIHTSEHGYREVLPPFLANSSCLFGTGNLPKFAADLFKVEESDYYLIPTAEVPVTNFYHDEILEENALPSRFVAYTPCFRKEAGAHGRDTRGLIRQHQFNKVELVKFSTPDRSYEELESLTRDAEVILQRLGLPYRVVTLCTGDLGFASAKTYDLEVWLPSQNRFREISSCSNYESFQARRARIRYRTAKGGKEFVHTLNGSGLAVGRTWLAILENFQQQDGSVRIPEALHPYMGGVERIARA